MLNLLHQLVEINFQNMYSFTQIILKYILVTLSTKWSSFSYAINLPYYNTFKNLVKFLNGAIVSDLSIAFQLTFLSCSIKLTLPLKYNPFFELFHNIYPGLFCIAYLFFQCYFIRLSSYQSIYSCTVVFSGLFHQTYLSHVPAS